MSTVFSVTDPTGLSKALDERIATLVAWEDGYVKRETAAMEKEVADADRIEAATNKARQDAAEKFKNDVARWQALPWLQRRRTEMPEMPELLLFGYNFFRPTNLWFLASQQPKIDRLRKLRLGLTHGYLLHLSVEDISLIYGGTPPC